MRARGNVVDSRKISQAGGEGISPLPIEDKSPFPALPCPHKGVVVCIERGQLAEDVVIRAETDLALDRIWGVVPGVVHHHPPVVEAVPLTT